MGDSGHYVALIHEPSAYVQQRLIACFESRKGSEGWTVITEAEAGTYRHIM